MIAASLALLALRLGDWNPWAQLGAMLGVLLVATRIAPSYFGWQQPRRHH
jgi:hypothetical protein